METPTGRMVIEIWPTSKPVFSKAHKNGYCAAVKRDAKIKWLALSLALTLFFFCSISAWADSDKSCLWRVRSGRGTVYLMGSVHFLDKDSYPLPPSLEQAYQESPTVVFETDIGSMRKPEVQEKMIGLALLPDGDRMQNHLSSNTYRKLEGRLVQMKIDPVRFERLKPWMAAQTIAMIQLIKLGFHPQYGVDQYFFQKTRQDGKEVHALESVDFQIELVSGLERYDQDAVIEKNLQEMDILDSLINEMHRAWRSGDCPNLGKLMNRSLEGFPELYDNFITARNRQWLPHIFAYIEKERDVLVTVGAGHLCGKNSLIDMLAELGVVAEQL